MKTSFLTGIALLVAGGAAVTAIAQPRPGGGTVTYWMSAETTSGLAASGANPASRGSMLGALAGRAPRADAFVHNLRLDLGSPRRAAGPPAADHFIPAGLNAGPSLPLVSPAPAAPVGRPSQMPAHPGNPQGRILIYWGCGERARPGQPFEIDLSRLARGQAPPAMANLPFRPMTPPSAATAATYGEWPNSRGRTAIPASGSLVGAHSVRGNYSPEINFTLAPGQDFLPPIVLTSNTRGPSGAVPVAWRAVDGARGYFLMAVGAREDNTMVMWSSSEVQFNQVGAMDYLAPDEIARLLQQRVLLQPNVTQCTVPAEVAGSVQAASLMMTAFGPEANFSHPAPPPRPPRGWAPEWTVKLRTRSAYMGMLGMDMAAMMRGESQDERQQERPRRRRGLLDRVIGQ
ncbi:MAG TPA: hypothetical protein VEW71_03320 [Allosphingosinicella sp.]|nr:hypothetical protein [Allosphingosinicella sp.]